MIIITNYTIQKKKDNYIVRANEPIRCSCGAEVLKRGSKGRYIVGNDGTKKRYILKRVYCPACDKLHMIVPDFIEPYKQYEKSAIDGVRNGTNDCSAADDSTIYRWKKL